MTNTHLVVFGSLCAACVAAPLACIAPLRASAQGGGAQLLEEVEAPPGVRFEDVVAGGASCASPESHRIAITDQGTAFAVVFESATIDAVKSSADCEVRARLHLPPGYSYTLANATYEGRTSFAEGMPLTFLTFHGAVPIDHEGDPGEFVTFYQLAGAEAGLRRGPASPAEQTWRSTPRYDYRFFDWSPCGRSTELVVFTSLYLAGQRPANQSGTASFTRMAITLEDLHFRRCQ